MTDLRVTSQWAQLVADAVERLAPEEIDGADSWIVKVATAQFP